MPIQLHFTVGWLLVVATLGLIGFWVPPSENILGSSYLIFFFHFPSAINCLNFFAFAGVVSLFHLARQTAKSDLWAASAVEVGVLACTITLVTGSFWAKAAWGHWWVVTDPRLMSVAIMWLTYLAYLALRGTIDEPTKRGRFCAVFGALATLNVPLVYFAIRIFGQENHPMNVEMSQLSMIVTRWFGAASFLVLYTAFWRMRYRVLLSRYEVLRLEEGLTRAGI